MRIPIVNPYDKATNAASWGVWNACAAAWSKRYYVRGEALDSKTLELRTLTAELDESHRLRDAAVSERNEHADECRSLESKLADLRGRHADVKSRAGDQAVEITLLLNVASERDDAIAEAAVESSKAEGFWRKLEAVQAELIQAREEHADTNACADEANAQHSSEVARLHEEVRAAGAARSNECAQWKGQVAHVESVRDTRAAERDAFEAELTQARAERDAAIVEIESTHKVRDAALRSAEGLRDDVDTLTVERDERACQAKATAQLAAEREAERDRAVVNEGVTRGHLRDVRNELSNIAATAKRNDEGSSAQVELLREELADFEKCKAVNVRLWAALNAAVRS